MTVQLRLATVAGLLAVLFTAPACSSSVSAGTAPVAPAHQAVPQKTATPFAGTTTIGALFPSPLVPLHICSASVIASADKSVIMTAAHCVRGGHDAGYVFAPDYHDGKAPYGFWKVTAAYGAPAWLHQTKASTHNDFAFLVVAPRRINGVLRKLQSVTGAIKLGSAPKRGTTVTVTGYPLGNGNAVRCLTRTFQQGVFPGFHCGGFADGTSGGPWVVGAGSARREVGLIGGLHQGGCAASTSYSPPLGRAAATALKRAAHHKPGDKFPNPPGDRC